MSHTGQPKYSVDQRSKLTLLTLQQDGPSVAFNGSQEPKSSTSQSALEQPEAAAVLSSASFGAATHEDNAASEVRARLWSCHARGPLVGITGDG